LESGAHLTILFYGLLLCSWYVLYRFNSARLATFLLGIIAIMIGMTRYFSTNQVPVHHLSNFVKTDELVTIEGFLTQPPEFGIYVAQTAGFEKRQYLSVETTWLEQGGLRSRVCGKVRLTLSDSTLPHPAAKTFAYGDVIRTRLLLRIPRNADETENFDYREFLRRRGIYFVGYLDHDRNIIKLPDQQGNFLFRWIYALQARILQFFDNYIALHAPSAFSPTADALQVIKAMTLGNDDELTPLVKAHFRQSGLYHLLVVSGVNVGILVWVVHQFFRLVHIPPRQGNILLPFVLFLHAGLTGFQFPVLRATIMALAIYLALMCNRISDPLYSLAFSGGLILLFFPTALFDVSFQLTVAATAFILLLLRFLQQFPLWERLSGAPYLLRMPLLTLLMTVGAMLGVSPLIAWYFQRIYLYSLVSNLLALPIISLFLPLSLVLSFFSFLLPWNLLSPLVFVDVILAKSLMFVAALFAGADVMILRPSPVILVVYYLVMACGLTLYRRKEKVVGQ